MTLRARRYEIWTIAPGEECQLVYPAHLSGAELAELEEWLLLIIAKLKRQAQSEAQPSSAPAVPNPHGEPLV